MYDLIHTKEQLFGTTQYNIYNYEGFAIWLEALLCNETGNKDIWNLKEAKLTDEQKGIYSYFLEQEKSLTRFGLMSQMGFPKYYDSKKILDVAKLIYGKAFNRALGL